MAKRRMIQAVDGDQWRKRAECRPENGYPLGLWDTEAPPQSFATRRAQRADRVTRQVTEKIAKEICNTKCQVRLECLEFAEINDEREGIWGGLNPQERGKTPLR